MYYLEKETLQEISKDDELNKALMAIDGLIVVMNHLYGKVEEKKMDFKSDVMRGHSEYLALGDGEETFYVDATEFNLFCEHLEEVIKEEMKQLKSYKNEWEIVQEFIKELSVCDEK